MLKSDHPPSISYVKEGTRAAREGLKVGDRVLKVNGQDVRNSPHQEVVDLIHEYCSPVELGIARLEEIFIDPLTSEEKRHFGKLKSH